MRLGKEPERVMNPRAGVGAEEGHGRTKAARAINGTTKLPKGIGGKTSPQRGNTGITELGRELNGKPRPIRGTSGKHNGGKARARVRGTPPLPPPPLPQLGTTIRGRPSPVPNNRTKKEHFAMCAPSNTSPPAMSQIPVQPIWSTRLSPKEKSWSPPRGREIPLGRVPRNRDVRVAGEQALQMQASPRVHWPIKEVWDPGAPML